MKWRVAVDRSLASLGLTHAQYSLLASLLDLQQDGTRPSQRRLADHTGLEPLYVSKLARTLETAGLLKRTPDPADTRAVQLALTAHGHTLTSRAVVLVQELMDRLLEPLGGLGGPDTSAFTRDLTALLDVPLDAPPTNESTKRPTNKE